MRRLAGPQVVTRLVAVFRRRAELIDVFHDASNQ